MDDASQMRAAASVRVVLITVPSDLVARDLARALVTEQLAACVNLVPGVTSMYRWKGELAEDSEVLLLVKTRAALLERLALRVAELHPYDTPELVALEPHSIEGSYLAWLVQSCTVEGS